MNRRKVNEIENKTPSRPISMMRLPPKLDNIEVKDEKSMKNNDINVPKKPQIRDKNKDVDNNSNNSNNSKIKINSKEKLSSFPMNSTILPNRLQGFPPEEIRRHITSETNIKTEINNQTKDINLNSEPTVCCSPKQLIERQPHRPFVPNLFQDYRSNGQIPISISASATNQIIGTEKIDEKLENTKSETDVIHSNDLLMNLRYEKQPVGGRNALIHRLTHLTQSEKAKSIVDKPKTAPTANKKNEMPLKSFLPYLNQQPLYPFNYYYPQENIYMFPQVYNPMMNPGMMMPPDLLNYPQHTDPTKANQFVPSAWPQTFPTADYQKVPEESKQLNQNIKSEKIQTEKKKSQLQFTPAMVRDQEHLVKTMKQQGINDEVVKRQFEALLNEQKKSLMSASQLESDQEYPDDHKKDRPKKFEEEKPDWMAHITPSLTYAHVQQTKPKEESKPVKSNENQSEKIADGDNAMNCATNDQQMNYGVGNLNKGYVNNYFIPSMNYLPRQDVPINYGYIPAQNHPYYSQFPGQFYLDNPDVYKYNQHENLVVQNKDINNNVKEKEIVSGRRNNLIKKHNGLQGGDVNETEDEGLNNDKQNQDLQQINLNKSGRKLQLSGIQELDDPSMERFIKRQPIMPDIKKSISANGLENQRNSNNPPPSPKLHLNYTTGPIGEYPRRKDLPPLTGNRDKNNEIQQNQPSSQNLQIVDHYAGQKNSFLAQVNQVQGGPVDTHNYPYPINYLPYYHHQQQQSYGYPNGMTDIPPNYYHHHHQSPINVMETYPSHFIPPPPTSYPINNQIIHQPIPANHFYPTV